MILSETITMGLRKKVSSGKTRPGRLNMLPFVSCHKEDNVEVMHFHMKSNCVQNLVFV